MKSFDLSKILSSYKNLWVSLSVDNKKVVASSASLKNLLNQLKKLGNPTTNILRVGGNYSSYVG